MKLLDRLREIAECEKDEQERTQPKESSSHPSPEQKKGRNNRVKKVSVLPKAVKVWEDYPEFVPLDYQPSPDVLRHVTGHELLYPQPWWQMDSVSCWKRCCVVIIYLFV